MTTVLVAGATGAVGSVLVPRLRSQGFDVIPHVRPGTAERHPLGKDAQALVVDLSDTQRLDAAMARVDDVVCLVGTMRRRFASGDTYETSDYRPVVQLAASAKRASPGEDTNRGPAAHHVPDRFTQLRYFVLLSALGAMPGRGYPGWKFKAEEAVRASGLPFTVLRPSFLDSTHAGAQPSDGRPRKPPPLVGGLLQAMRSVPGMRGIADDLRPLPVEVLCDAIATILRDRAPGGVVTGRTLWTLAGVSPKAGSAAER